MEAEEVEAEEVEAEEVGAEEVGAEEVEVEAEEQTLLPCLASDYVEPPPEIFTGEREKADRFLSQLKRYYLANIGVPEFNSWIRKVVIACTYIQGPLVDKWVDRAVDWLSQLDPLIDDIEDVWVQFLDAFAEQFQDSQKGECAHTGLGSIKMTWPLIDQYIQDFEQLAAEAGYTLGDTPTNRYFVRGLVPSVGKDVFKPSPSDNYQVLKKRAILYHRKPSIRSSEEETTIKWGDLSRSNNNSGITRTAFKDTTPLTPLDALTIPQSLWI